MLALGVAACTPIQAQRGQLVTDDQLAQLKIGETAKAEVTAMLGTPTTVAAFDDKQWYYIGEDTKQIGIHPPIIEDRRIVALKFDDNGTLVDKRILSAADAQQIAMRAGATKVTGQEPNILQQLIGNVGRFSGGDSDSKGGVDKQ